MIITPISPGGAERRYRETRRGVCIAVRSRPSSCLYLLVITFEPVLLLNYLTTVLRLLIIYMLSYCLIIVI